MAKGSGKSIENEKKKWSETCKPNDRNRNEFADVAGDLLIIIPGPDSSGLASVIHSENERGILARRVNAETRLSAALRHDEAREIAAESTLTCDLVLDLLVLTLIPSRLVCHENNERSCHL
jgi:hypothetical protein